MFGLEATNLKPNMAEHPQLKNSMRVLSYAKQHKTTISKAQEACGVGKAYLRRYRAKITADYVAGQISSAEYTAYNNAYNEATGEKQGERYTKNIDFVQFVRVDTDSTPTPYVLTTSTQLIDEDEEMEVDKGTRTWETRDNRGRITSYGYRILNRGHLPLEGELSRAQMERFYALYPYNTLETVSSEFAFLTAEDLGRIARAFGIKKTKKVPKHIIEESPEEKIAEFEVNAKLKHVSKKMEVHKSAILERQNKSLQEEIEYYRRANEWAEAVVENYFQRNPEPVTLRTIYMDAVQDEPMGINTYTLFSDIHFGKLFPTKKIRYGRGTDKHMLRGRCHRIARETVKSALRNGSPEIHLICAGDLFEAIMPGGMHQGQVMDLTGDEQVFFALDVFEEMFAILQAGVHTSVKIKLHGIGGNHDRIQQKREEDRKRTGTLLFYGMLERLTKLRYANHPRPIEIIHDYEDGIISFAVEEEGLSFVGHHGDSPLSKKAAEKQMNMHKVGDSQNFTVLFQGHMHSHKCLDEGPNYVYLQIGAVTSGDAYSQNTLSEGSQPSFLIGSMAEEGAYGFDFKKYTLA